MSELKKCPFCGAEAAYAQILGNYERPHEVYCSGCDGGITEGRSKDGVIHNWNTRPIEDALQARIAELEAENAGLKERVAMLDVTAVFKSLGEMGYIEQTNKLHARIAELESLVEQLIWVGNDLLVSNTNPVTIALFNGLVCNAKEREE